MEASALAAATAFTYLVLLRVEIARFTRNGCPLRLVSVALILTSRWTGVTCYAALCSPDVPPVPCFHDCTSGGLAGFTSPLSQRAGKIAFAALHKTLGDMA
jgi:hypothetical protein